MPHSTGPNLVLVRLRRAQPIGDKRRQNPANREIPMTKAALDPENRDKIPVGPTLKCHKMSLFVVCFSNPAPSLLPRQEPGPGFSVDRERFTELRYPRPGGRRLCVDKPRAKGLV